MGKKDRTARGEDFKRTGAEARERQKLCLWNRLKVN